MTFLRNLQHDLVDKKLWPLALILVLALVAVPVLLGGGGGEPASVPAPGATAAPPIATAAGASPSVAEVAVAVEEPTVRRRKGSTRDPFKQQYAPKTLTATAPGESAAPTTQGTGDTKAPSDSGSGDTKTTPSTTEPKKETPDVDPLDVYRVSLRFGEPGEQKTIRDIARLSPLPNADRPFFVFLGVLSGGKKAVFLISSDATATGDGTCRPSKANCETVELEKGETEFFDLETESGVVQYQLDLVTLKRRVPLDNTAAVAAQAKARAAAARKAAARRKKARELAAEKGTEDPGADDVGSDRYRWDEKRGVLVRRVKSSKVSMNVGGGLIGVLRDAGDGLVALADGSWQAADPAADDAPAVVGGP